MEAGAYQERSLLKRSLSWDLNDEEEKLSAEQRNRGPVTETRLVYETEHIQCDWRADSRGPWQMSPSMETCARPLQATAGVGLLLKAKGGNWRVWTNQRRVVGRDLIHTKGSLRLPCEKTDQELKQEVQLQGARLSSDRIKLRQKQMNMD